MLTVIILLVYYLIFAFWADRRP